MAGFGINGIEPSGSATTVLVSKMDLSEIGCEDGRWMELAQHRVQWQGLYSITVQLSGSTKVLAGKNYYLGDWDFETD
jgi:hypothetical protein